MVALAKQQSASQAQSYYVNELKHEISQAYYRHYERILQAEEHTLALEIYLRSYTYKDVAQMKISETACFAAQTIEFYIANEAHKSVRLNLADQVLLPVTHRALVLEPGDELAIHYFNLIGRVNDRAQSEELTALISRIDSMADRMPVTTLVQNLKKMGGFVNKALLDMQLRLQSQSIKVSG